MSTGEYSPITVNVSDFDSLTQALNWVNKGPSEALQRFTAMLRVALIGAERVYVDRNQLLDGICFLALGPRGVRSLLGLQDWQPIPLVVGTEPVVPPREYCPVIHARRQLAAVRRTRFVSAARLALGAMGGVEGLEPRQRDLLRILFAEPECPVPAPRDRVVEEAMPWMDWRRLEDPSLIDVAREEWTAELCSASVTMVAWPMMGSMTAQEFWEPGGMAADPLNSEDATVQGWARGLKEEVTAGITKETPVVPRSRIFDLLAKRLDDEAVQRDPSSLLHAQMALRWWTYLYNEAIYTAAVLPECAARSDGDSGVPDPSDSTCPPSSRPGTTTREFLPTATLGARMAFWNTFAHGASTGGGSTTWLGSIAALLRGLVRRENDTDDEVTRVEKAWGLYLEEGELQPRRIRVSGSLLEEMRTAQTPDYLRFRDHPLVRPVLVTENGPSRGWLDVALAMREMAPSATTWSRRFVRQVIKTSTLVSVVIVLTLHDSGVLAGHSGVQAALWTLLAVIVSLPTAEILEVFNLRPAAMSWTVRVSRT